MNFSESSFIAFEAYSERFVLGSPSRSLPEASLQYCSLIAFEGELFGMWRRFSECGSVV
jgi:hypothetical protein